MAEKEKNKEPYSSGQLKHTELRDIWTASRHNGMQKQALYGWKIQIKLGHCSGKNEDLQLMLTWRHLPTAAEGP